MNWGRMGRRGYIKHATTTPTLKKVLYPNADLVGVGASHDDR